MTVLTLALLAGSQPAAPRLAPVHQIGPQSRRQSPHTPCAPLVRPAALPLPGKKPDRHKRSAPPSSSHTPWPNPHSACGTAAAPLPAISCLGAFRPPAARARGEGRHCRQPKTCTDSDIGTPGFNLLVGEREQRGRDFEPERLRGSEVDDELELGRLLDWNIRWLFAFQYLVDEFCRAPVQLPTIRSIRQQSTGLDKFPVVVDRGEPQLCCEIDDLPAKPEQEGSFQHHEARRAGLGRGLDAERESIGRSHLADFETLPARVSGALP